MGNKIINPFTVDDLETRIDSIGLPFKTKKELLRKNIEVLNNNNFYTFLKDSGFDDFELSYTLFGKIIDYLKFCHGKKNTEGIQEMFTYIDQITQSKNEDVIDLISAGLFENFDLISDILPELVPFMPPHLKALFLEHFSDYLNLK